MRIASKAIAALLTALLFAFPPFADAKKEAPSQATEQTATPTESDLASHGHYINKDKEVVHSPSKSVSGKVPSGASAKCRDGSYSFSRHHSGTCSHHGGVAQWIQ
jgi:hypothetical protein